MLGGLLAEINSGPKSTNIGEAVEYAISSPLILKSGVTYTNRNNNKMKYVY